MGEVISRLAAIAVELLKRQVELERLILIDLDGGKREWPANG